jgi:DNA polymerase-3 subunit epsilon
MFIYPTGDGRYQHTHQGFAVIDLETTGFDAVGSDRIVEVAVVRTDSEGRELGVYETLVNPGRPLAASPVHHITDVMVADAPTFPEITDSLLAWLRGVVVVAHNAGFEDAFLTAAFRRAGVRMPALPALDTLPLAQSFVPTRNHRLATVCSWAGIRIEGAHTAAGDARATAQMLPHLLAEMPRSPRWRSQMPEIRESIGGRYLPREALVGTVGT